MIALALRFLAPVLSALKPAVVPLVCGALALGGLWLADRARDRIEELKTDKALLQQNIAGQEAARAALAQQINEQHRALIQREAEYRRATAALAASRAARREVYENDPVSKEWSRQPVPGPVAERLRARLCAAAGAATGSPAEPADACRRP